ncbi:NAD(P)-dependent alcohol dehydrogenase [Mechercharimyces sp. CAU 1602]|uniref:NAD(P)-dependent alcohol dehydrogenase n=1 Tax=Mechercharimyces sp. CAU 1602 TaxID=2973933 RepID=UPI0021638C4A|nr:NAD(P)-dependent alcohol dehydrogenase [Mechercharimyces sp. CAU 1602]MCS1350939.1 NAD(P)-dependent alcohol dehydrogenase [Mechercharimyces sp. CAU 1602]
MKAVSIQRYGPPEVLQVTEVKKPSPQEDEVLIKVHESIVTPADCAFRKADPVIIRFFNGLWRPKNLVLGVEFAGIVEAVGTKVTQFSVGDRVFGSTAPKTGAHAEYVCIPESGVVVSLPAQVSFSESVGICDGGMTAYTFLKEECEIKPGYQVLINGASGSVGSFAVQLAKEMGTEVTGVCSTANTELVKSFGADHVIDYTSSDFTQTPSTYDIIFDAVGKSSFARCKRALKPTGVYLTTVPTLSGIMQMVWTKMVGKKKAKFAATGLKQTKEKLQYLLQMCEQGKIRSMIDRRYSLEEVVTAHRYVETGRKKGNVILSIYESK